MFSFSEFSAKKEYMQRLHDVACFQIAKKNVDTDTTRENGDELIHHRLGYRTDRSAISHTYLSEGNIREQIHKMTDFLRPAYRAGQPGRKGEHRSVNTTRVQSFLVS